MEATLALFASSAGTGAAAAAGSATTATVVSAGASGAASLFGTVGPGLLAALPTMGTALGFAGAGLAMFSALSGGNQEAKSMSLYAKQSELQARSELAKGREKALLLREQLESDLASQNTIFASRGVNMREGSVRSIQDSTRRYASDDITNTLLGSKTLAQSKMFEAQQYKSQGSSAQSSGMMGAFGALLSSRSGQSLLQGISS